nr:hypothetical protein [Nonomuraea wenchangensis]
MSEDLCFLLLELLPGYRPSLHELPQLYDLVGHARLLRRSRHVESGDLVLDGAGQRLELGLLAAAEHDAVLVVDGVDGLPAELATPLHSAGDAELDEPVVDQPCRFDLHGRYLADVDPLVGVADGETRQPSMTDGDELAIELHPAA